MVPRLVRSLALAVVLFLLVWSAADPASSGIFAQEDKPPVEKKTYKLAVQFAKKDIIEKESKTTVSFEGKMVMKLDIGGNVQEMPSDQSTDSEQSEKYTETVLDVTDSGAVKKVRREYQSSVVTTTRETEEGDKTDKEETPLDGKTFVIERMDDPEEGFEAEIEGSKEDFPEAAKRMLTLDEQPLFLLPANEVAVGETWTPTEDNLKKYLTGALAAGGSAMPTLSIKSVDGSAECKLKEVVEEENRRRAVVSYKVEAEIEMDPKELMKLGGDTGEDEEGESPLKNMSAEMGMKTKLTGEFEICLVSAKLVRHEVSGSFSMEMSSEQSIEGMGTVEMNMKATGSMEKKETWKVSKEE